MENNAMIVPRNEGFEVHVSLKDLVWNADHFKDLLNRSLSGTGIHACMYLYDDVAHFGTPSFTQWSEKIAKMVLKKINASCYADYVRDTNQKKLMRKTRDAFNKCNDPKKIEFIAEILGVSK